MKMSGFIGVFVITAVVMAIVFRVPQLRNIVTGQA